jgi:hypothetical protein
MHHANAYQVELGASVHLPYMDVSGMPSNHLVTASKKGLQPYIRTLVAGGCPLFEGLVATASVVGHA